MFRPGAVATSLVRRTRCASVSLAGLRTSSGTGGGMKGGGALARLDGDCVFAAVEGGVRCNRGREG